MMMRVGRGVSSLRIDSARPAIRVTGQEMGIRERERGEREYLKKGMENT
jgi:hypothetical protein